VSFSLHLVEPSKPTAQYNLKDQIASTPMIKPVPSLDLSTKRPKLLNIFEDKVTKGNDENSLPSKPTSVGSRGDTLTSIKSTPMVSSHKDSSSQHSDVIRQSGDLQTKVDFPTSTIKTQSNRFGSESQSLETPINRQYSSFSQPQSTKPTEPSPTLATKEAMADILAMFGMFLFLMLIQKERFYCS
jgi:hypothetical protein